MKAWFWLLLTVSTLLVGCAQGYYDSRPAYREPAPAWTWQQNAETEAEWEMRMWREEAGSH